MKTIFGYFLLVVISCTCISKVQAQYHLYAKTGWKEQPNADSLYKANAIAGFSMRTFTIEGDSAISNNSIYSVFLNEHGKNVVDTLIASNAFSTRYVYNDQQQLVEQRKWFRGRIKTTTFSYTSNVFISAEEERGLNNRLQWRHYYSYNGYGQMVEMVSFQGETQTDTSNYYTFAYDDAGLLIKQKSVLYKPGVGGVYRIVRETTFAYDAQDQLISETVLSEGKTWKTREWIRERNSNDLVLIDHQKRKKILYEYSENGLLIQKSYFNDAGKKIAYSKYTYF